VPDNYVAWAVGGKVINEIGGSLNKIATNTNSLSIELADPQKLCDTNKFEKEDKYTPEEIATFGYEKCRASDETINNALALVRKKMEEYGIDKDHVIRHFDVTGKLCPIYWVQDERWKNEFWDKI